MKADSNFDRKPDEGSGPGWLPYIFYLFLTGILAVPIIQDFHKWGVRDWDLFTTLHAAAVRSVVEFGQFPFWNPYIGGGNILFAHPEVPVLNPLFGLLLLIGPLTGLKIQILVVYFIGLVGFYKLSRQIGISYWGSFLPPIAFMLSSYLTLHIAVGHIPFHYFAAFPWLMFFYKKSLERPIHILSAGGVVAFIILGSGAAVPLVFSVFFLLLFSLFDIGEKHKFRPPVFIAVAVFCGILFSAAKFFPMFDYLTRHPWVPDVGIHVVTPFKSLFDMFFNFNQSIFAEHIRSEEFIWGWHEYGVFIGPVVAILAAIGLMVGFKKAWPYLLLTIFSIALALGSFAGSYSPWDLLHHLPGFSSMRVPSRFTLLALICVAILTGYGVDFLRSRFKYRRIALTAVILCALIGTHLYVCLPVLGRAFNRQAEHPTPGSDFRQLEGDPNRMYAAFLSNRGTVRAAWISAYRPGRSIISYDGRILEWYSDNSAVEVLNREFTPNRITFDVQSATGGKLVISQGYDNGWRASDGRKINSRADLIAFDVKPADRRIEIYYYPDYFTLGAIVSALSILAALIGTVTYMRSR